VSDFVSLNVLQAVGGEVLADAAFKFLDPAEAASFEEGDVMSASLSYKTDHEEGVLHFSSTESFAQELASNLLGCDPEEAGIDNPDLMAMGEMVNVLAGAVLSQVVGEKDVDLGIPNPQRLSKEQWQQTVDGNQDAIHALFEDEEGNVVSLCVQSTRSGS